jgi:hypothetical protein
MQYVYYIRKRKDGEPPISIVEMSDIEDGDYVTIHFDKKRHVTIKSNNKKYKKHNNNSVDE